ncbi:MarR family winged helix-turn-helix transcriptional regulator [Methylocella sp.]|uniref:MarR family winged helix-turn-helix transcriptional regulator n=1 Tax=Methylocella sp. TaxID=1978226 RepID=UPI0037840794
MNHAARDLRPGARGTAGDGDGRRLGEEDADFELIELLFFAYRDFVADADRLLEAFGFGRAHHRVLHFVSRNPGLSIAELLDILKITKQSLNRVLKDLLDQGYVAAEPGEQDRRRRRLYATARGRALALEAAQRQSRRFQRVFAALPKDARPRARDFLLAMIDAAPVDPRAARTPAPPAPRRDRKASHA